MIFIYLPLNSNSEFKLQASNIIVINNNTTANSITTNIGIQEMNQNNEQQKLMRLISLLEALQTDKVNQAEKLLKQQAQRDNQLFFYLVSLIKNPRVQFVEQVKSSAAFYINNAICDAHFNYSLKELVDLIVSLLRDTSIEPKFKRLLERSIVSIIDQLQEPAITQFRQVIYTMMQQQRLRDTAYLLIGCFCVPDSMDRQHIIFLIRMYMNQTLSRIVLANTQQSIHLAKQYNEILKMWIVAINYLFNNTQKQQESEKVQTNKLLYQIATSDNLINLIISLYKWMALQPIYICNHQNLYQLNILKQQAAQLHATVLQSIRKRFMEQLNTFKFLTITGLNIKGVIDTLILVANNHKVLQDLNAKDFVVNLIKVLTTYLICNPPVFKNQWKLILKMIIFPLMKPNQEELYAFQQNPSDYCSLFQDCSEKQLFGIPKTQICHFLQKIGDKSQQITQQQYVTDFIINFLVDSIKNYWSRLNENPYQIDYVNFDVAIFAISIFSFRLQKHEHKLAQLKQSFCKEIAYKMTPYQKCLAFMFLSYNYGQLYTLPDQGSHWVELALSEHEHPTLVYCANDFLDNIADQYYSDFFFQQLSIRTLNNETGVIWNGIQKLIKTQGQRATPQLMLQLMQNIYKRMELQIQKVQKQAIKQTIHLIKLVQIIRAISQKNNYCRQHPEVVNQIWKIMHAYKIANKFSFQDQILFIIYSMVKMQQVISQKSISVLPIILHEFAQDEYYDEIFYKILNNYIMKSTFDVVAPIYDKVKNGILFHLMNMGQSIKKSQKRMIFSYKLLLLQNIIAMHGKGFNEDSIIEIGAIIMRFIPTQNNYKIDDKVVLARALNTLLMVHMLMPIDDIWNRLQLFTTNQIYFRYDLMVLIKCIKKLIFNEPNVQIIAQMVTIVTQAISGFIKRLKADKNSKKIRQKYGKDNRLKLNKYKQYERILKYLDTPFIISPFNLQKQLSELLETLNQLNKQMFARLTTLLSKQITQIICTICKYPWDSILNKRVKYVVLRPKPPEQVQKQERQQEMNSDNEEDIQQIKRNRLQIKKKKKKGNNSNNQMI